MNYSRSIFVVSLIEEIIGKIGEEKNRLIIKNWFSEYLKERKGKVDRQKESDTTWKTTEAEVDELNELTNIDELLSIESSDKVIKRLVDAKERIVNKIPKIKVAFFTQEFSLWPSFQSVWEEFEADESCNSDLVFLPYTHKSTTPEFQMFNYDCYKDQNYPIIHSNDYSIIKNCADIAIYMKPYGGIPAPYHIVEIQKHIKFTTFISYCLEIQGGCTELLYGMPFFYRVWKYIAYSNYNKNMMIENGYRNGENVEIIGHPKFDSTHKIISEKAFVNKEWQKKINSRKVIMWNTHFSVLDNEGVGTFFQWKDTIFEYFRKNNDVVLLWRGHPFFWDSIVQYPNINQEILLNEIKEFEKLDNVIIDKTADYRYAFCLSDALISDAATFLVEYNSTGRPVMFTPKVGGESVCDDKYIENLYIGETAKQIEDYINMVIQGEDELKDKRRSSFVEEFGEPDGTVGLRIKQYLIKEVQEEQAKAAKKLLEEAFLG